MAEYSESLIDTLKELDSVNMPVGAIYLSEKMNIPQATVGRLLYQLEDAEYVKKVGNKGRILTDSGRELLKDYEKEKDQIETVQQLANLYTNGIDKEKMLEVLEVRMLLEAKAAELASKNGTEQEIKELEKCLLEWKLGLHNEEHGSDEDLQLHLMIAKMSNNATLSSMCKLLLTEDNIYTAFTAEAGPLKACQMEHHEAIVEAIKNHQPDEASLSMYRHLEAIRDAIVGA